MNEENLYKFIKWLSLNIEEFKDKTPNEVVETLNKKSSTENGMNEISGLISQFKKKSTEIFKKGGKIDLLIKKFKGGGKSAQRASDSRVKNFHGIDLFEYSHNRYKTSNVYLARDLKPGVTKGILPNGVGIRQITNNNITTTELVSPDKRDTLYIHNGIGGRVDSNLDDSGILGILGLRDATPVSNRYKELQNKFNIQKFDDGGETEGAVKSRVVTNPLTWKQKTDSKGTNYYIMPADTVDNIVHRAVARETTTGEPALIITEQRQVVGDPGDTKTRHSKVIYSNIKTDLKNGEPLIKWGSIQDLPSGRFGRLFKKLSEEDKKIFELYDIK